MAAETFAAFPIWILLAFRSYEILLPILLSISIAGTTKNNVTRSAIVFSIAAFAMGGAMFSRGAVALLLLLMLIYTQNMLSRKKLRTLLVWTASAGLAAAAVVTIQRATLQQAALDSNFYAREFLERLDGLEIVSKLSNEAGTFSSGIEPTAIAVPLIASLSFLPGAAELKMAGLTTVKAVILASYFGIDSRDVNSFFILDTYYIGGWSFVILAFFTVGACANFLDSRIGLHNNKIRACLLIAAASNFLILEREFIGFIFGTLRDVIIVFFALKLLCDYKTIMNSSIIDR
ncbi:MAG: hypothetical protein ACT4NV_03540 [Rhodoferax sp.]